MTPNGYDKGTSIVCTGHKTPMDCCCWFKAYTKVRTKLIFIFLFVLGWMAAPACGEILIKCSLTIHSRCCALSVTAVYAKPSPVH